MVWESLRISRWGCQTRAGRRFFTAGCSAGSLTKVAVTARRSRRQASRAECTKLPSPGSWSSSASLILTLRFGGSVSWAAKLTPAGRKGQRGNTPVRAATTRACRSACTSRQLANWGDAARAFGHCCHVRFRTAMGRAGFRAAQRRPGAVLGKPARRSAATAVLRTAAMTCADDPARSRWASSSMVVSRSFSRGGARPAELDLRVSAGQRLVVMKVPDATGVVQVPRGVLCQRVAADWLSWVISSRLAVRAAASSSPRSSSCRRRSAACCS